MFDLACCRKYLAKRKIIRGKSNKLITMAGVSDKIARFICIQFVK